MTGAGGLVVGGLQRDGDRIFTSGYEGEDVWHPASRAVENSGPD